jgi:hypothetical protein
VHGNPVGRVKLGEGFCRHSLFELFLDNLDLYPPLLPVVDEADVGWLQHLRLLNGTIWRWCRPIIGLDKPGDYHLRIEQRVAAAGPSLADCIANAAFSIGMSYHLARSDEAPETRIDFETCRDNFYACARAGLGAEITWLDGQRHRAGDLLLTKLIPDAATALAAIGVDRDEIDHYLRGLLHERVASGQTGAAFQRAWIGAHGTDFPGLVDAYARNMAENKPVHRWRV